MQPVIDLLSSKVAQAMSAATGQDDCNALVKPSGNPKFGDYQSNGIMALAKKLKTNPRQLAQQVVDKLDIADICETPEIAGPGFINLRLKTTFLVDRLLEINADANRLAVDEVTDKQTVVVDFSGPNIAKQMHVGHLRSTIIGDSISRMLDFLGNKVIRQNHIGDWGTQFGMLAYYLDYRNSETDTEYRKKGLTRTTTFDVSIANMEEFYREAKKHYDTDADFAERSRQYVVELHSNERTHALFNWEIIRSESLSHCYKIYGRLGVTLDKEDIRGESFYRDVLSGIVKGLGGQGLAVESDGAMCVFLEGFKNKEDQPLPFIIQKSDGAFLYATTDLAAMRFRLDELKAKRIIYVTDARQKLHFQMLFGTTEAASWKDDDVKLQHVTFGTVLGEDGKPFKTRSGENIKLSDLLDEAVTRAKAVVESKNPDLSDAEKDSIANAVGIGAIKYADYSNNRESDYVFSFDKMLAMEGNTAPYMQYAFARIKSIERKAKEKGVDIEKDLKGLKKLNLTDAAELDLAKHILRYSEAIESAAAECRPNYLTSYLYELSQKFSTFYNDCPVLIAEEDKRPTRLLLCKLTEKTIAHGLTNLLGIDVVEKM